MKTIVITSAYFNPTHPWHIYNFQETKKYDSIKYIDYIIFFDQETPIESISTIIPDVLIKWWDYKAEEVVGYQEVVDNGWKVVIIPIVQGYSTKNSVQKILSTK